MAPSTRQTVRVREVTSSEGTMHLEKQRKLQKRLLAELQIDGTGLKGEFPERKSSVNWRGARFEAWTEPEETRKESPRPRKYRKFERDDARHAIRDIIEKRSACVATNTRSQRPQTSRTRTSTAQDQSPDEEFLKETISQLKASLAPKTSIRWQDITRAMPILKKMAVPAPHRIRHRANNPDQPKREEADLYLLDSAEAHHLLNSNEEIPAPVFVPGGAQPLFPPSTSPSRRPVVQIFDYFHNPNERDETLDISLPTGSHPDIREFTLRSLRSLFLSPSSSPPIYPYNFPDLLNPFPSPPIPPFCTGTPKVTLLRTLATSLLDLADPSEICPPTCPQRKHAALFCRKHKLNPEELLHFQSGWLRWQSTMMLSLPGGITHPHWDKWGFGTWVGCYEGEIGFGWLVGGERGGDGGVERGRAEWLKRFCGGGDDDCDGGGDARMRGKGMEGEVKGKEGRWVFAVLRPGDAIYLPPGTVHMVFRKPGGGQTLAFAGHLLRCGDVGRWLRTLRADVEMEIRAPDENTPYGEMVPCLVAGIKGIIDARDDDMSLREMEWYGGLERVEEARGLLKEIEKLVRRL